MKEETRVKNLIVVGVIAILLGATFVPVVSGHINGNIIQSRYTSPEDSQLSVSEKDEMVTIVTQKYGPSGMEEVSLQVSSEEAEETARDLEALKEAIEIHDKNVAFLLASKLRQMGVFQDDSIFALVNKYLNGDIPLDDPSNSFNNLNYSVWGSGTGVVTYLSDLAIIFSIWLRISSLMSFMLPNNLPSDEMLELLIISIIFAFLLSILPISLLHLLPRFIVPRVYINFLNNDSYTGNITATGHNGTITYSSGEYKYVQMQGFIGFFFGFYITPPKLFPPFYFCFGCAKEIEGVLRILDLS